MAWLAETRNALYKSLYFSFLGPCVYLCWPPHFCFYLGLFLCRYPIVVGSNIKNVEELAHYPALGKIEQSYCPRKLSRERTPIWPNVGGLRLAVSFLFISRYFFYLGIRRRIISQKMWRSLPFTQHWARSNSPGKWPPKRYISLVSRALYHPKGHESREVFRSSLHFLFQCYFFCS